MDDLNSDVKIGEEVTTEPVMPATLHNWHRACGGKDIDAATELTEPREQNPATGSYWLRPSWRRAPTRHRVYLQGLFLDPPLEAGAARSPPSTLAVELESTFTAPWGALATAYANSPETAYPALQEFWANNVEYAEFPPGRSWDDGYIESFNRPATGSVASEIPVQGRSGWRRLQASESEATSYSATYRGVAFTRVRHPVGPQN